MEDKKNDPASGKKIPSSSMKNIVDAIQIGLQIPGFGFLVAFALVVLAAQAAKLAAVALSATVVALRSTRFVVFKFWGFQRVVWLSLLALPIYIFSAQISNALQYAEQMYLRPVYVVSDTSAWAVSVYEGVLKKHTTESQFQAVRDSTYRLAADLGCDPIAIYEVAYSECGLNPFCIRADGIAAGWIQFTALGLSGFGVSLAEVKSWCKNGDAVSIMAMTGKYMRRWAGGRKPRTSADVYCAVFAPGKIDAAHDDVLYKGWNNPEYYMNKCLDGYKVVSGKALYLPYTMDGILTKNDLKSALAFKKSTLLRKYQ